MSTVPKNVRGYLPESDHPDAIPVPVHVGSESLGERVPMMSGNPDQWIAASGMILRVLVGSTVHGTAIDGQDDRDELGIAVEPPRTVIGSRTFTNYQYRTAEPDGQKDGKSACSGPGDLDLSVYSLRKFVGLASAGNPTVLLPLFVPDEHVCYINDGGRELRDRADLFVSRAAAPRFIGYLRRKRDGLLGLRSDGTRNQGRADLRALYGWDCKFGMHMVRLGIQGVELLSTGRITLPVPEPELTYLRDVRQGKYSKEDTLARAEELEKELVSLANSSRLPDRPDMDAIDAWVIDVHVRYWGVS